MAQILPERRGLAISIAVLLAGGSISPARADDGAALYGKRCLSCHGEHGKGDGPVAGKLKTQPVDLSVALAGKNDAYVAKVIRGGGAAVGKSVQMPAAKTLTDGEIDALVAYVKSLTSR